MRDGSQRTNVDRMCRDMVNARTPEEILSAVDEVNSHQEAIAATQPEDVDTGALSQLQQLIVRPGESGGVLTRTEFMVAKFCAEAWREPFVCAKCAHVAVWASTATHHIRPRAPRKAGEGETSLWSKARCLERPNGG